jgi:uncharacterized protein
MHNLPHEKIADFCRRRHIRRMSLFGSRVRGDPRPDSDLDVLVEFDPQHTPGLDFFAMQDELSEIIGVRVDLNTAGFISPYFRDEVIRQAEPIYAQS